MSTQFSTNGSGINNVEGLDEMLKKLGMSPMETALNQPMTQNTQFNNNLNANTFIAGFMQPNSLQTYNMNYGQPLPFQPMVPIQPLMEPNLPSLDQNQALNLQNVSDSLASIQYSLSNMLSMTNASFPLQNSPMLDPSLNTFNTPLGLNNVLAPVLGQNAFYSPAVMTPQLSPNLTSNFFTPSPTITDVNGFMGSPQLDASTLMTYGIDQHLVEGPPGLKDVNTDTVDANGMSFENDVPALDINLDGSSEIPAPTSLLIEGLLDQDIAEETLSSFSPNSPNDASKKGPKVGADARTEAFQSTSPVSDQQTASSPVAQQQTSSNVVPPVVVTNPEPEKPSGPKPFSWADITKTTAAPTTAAPTVNASSSTTTTTTNVASTSSTTPPNNANNSTNNVGNSKNNQNNNNKNNNNNNKANANNPNQNNNNKVQQNNKSNNANANTNTNNKNNATQGDNKLKKPLPSIDNLDLSKINPSDFNCNPSYAKFFVIKSYSEDDIHKSIKYGIWTSTESGNKRLDRAYRECAGKGPVYLFFSVNSSGQFCGLAEMTSPLDYSKKASCWNEDKWSGQFTVTWLFIKDIQNVHLRHVKLVNNENKPVTNSRDTQEVLYQPGCEVLQVFHRFQSKNSILDDFSYYNECEKEQKGQKEPNSK